MTQAYSPLTVILPWTEPTKHQFEEGLLEEKHSAEDPMTYAAGFPGLFCM